MLYNFEKVNPAHPDKVADRIAGAIVDLAYKKENDPKIAVEVLIGHGNCHIICESSVEITNNEVQPIVDRIAGPMALDLQVVPQDKHLARNQVDGFRCGDNGIFVAYDFTAEEEKLTYIAQKLYEIYPTDGKLVMHQYPATKQITICQSNADADEIRKIFKHSIEEYPCSRACLFPYHFDINPLGYWTGGTDVDTGATNRKLGSDMGRSVTGAGLHGKDLSKADVSVNICLWQLTHDFGGNYRASCAIGDEYIYIFEVDEIGNPLAPCDKKYMKIEYSEIVERAKKYINRVGGFEKFAEWGLIR